MIPTHETARPPAAVLCVLIVGIFYVATIRDGHDWGDDFSMYIRHAQNIARGEPYAQTGYIYNAQNPAVGPRVYPPGFPLMLAPVVAAFGLELRPMKIVVIAFFVGSLLVIPLMFRDTLPAPHAAALVLAVGLNPVLWDMKDQILSDIPFQFLALASLGLIARMGACGTSARRDAAFAVVSGAAAYAAYATRTVGVILIPCLAAQALSRNRRIRTGALTATAIVAGLAAVQYVIWYNDASYFDQVSNPIAAVRQNVPAYLRALSDVWENGHFDLLRKVGFLASTGLAAVGFVSSFRSGVTIFHLFPLLYLAAVMAWPSYQGIRLLIPVLPFYFWWCLLGARAIDTVAEHRWAARHLVLVAFLLALLASYAARYSTMEFGALSEGIAKRESRELFAFVTASTGPDDVLVFSRPRALALMTGRNVSGGYSPADACRLWEYIGDISASYVITGPGDDPFNGDAIYLRRFAARFADDLRAVMANRDVTVYRVERNPCPRRSGGSSRF